MESIRVRFVYFAGCREAVGRPDDTVDLPSGATLATALDWIETHRPPLAGMLRSVRVAVNHEFANREQRLAAGDEIVLIPPVSGGSGTRAALTRDPLPRHAAQAMIEPAGAGALVTFDGVVRPTSKTGRAVTDLFYDAYEPMALGKLEQCLEEAAQRWQILDAAVVHRLGALALGDVAVSIAVASGHRGEAFAACSYVIDRIKQIVPIWKKETGPDGAEWVSEGA